MRSPQPGGTALAEVEVQNLAPSAGATPSAFIGYSIPLDGIASASDAVKTVIAEQLIACGFLQPNGWIAPDGTSLRRPTSKARMLVALPLGVLPELPAGGYNGQADGATPATGSHTAASTRSSSRRAATSRST